MFLESSTFCIILLFFLGLIEVKYLIISVANFLEKKKLGMMKFL